MPAFGDPPNYSTPRTLGLALTSILGSLAHFTLGALDYEHVSRYLGLAVMLLAGLLLVYGVLTLIRYAEAITSMQDPHARTPMYNTPHETLTYRVGVGLNALAACSAVAWAVGGELPLWHLGAGVVNVWAAYLAWLTRPVGEG
ncbi:hypothetical protein QR90_11425 [Deinococcus radiopugnans]|uniref:Uncharacterized protein n=2 Tax=Deinococcus radiopugnans TaxID=57497 RepID=A0A0A7KJY1_9DEIO|nr:hypothetical protein [Deinococcus radiopugnans]AIZ45559.1 hypothetical protein QR90_11425 [Deinococcus radiopugnans]MBB6016134.1 hypothetical protein [Deinococcus radiopugnans ATCC 19172]QLG11284.1 hypothetical protein HLB42_11195 [Deinococcus sp. D7000]TNM72157.1 hypothetical protein FHR04_04825 [Deinococcus radiopugnans ATCC 19172]